MTGWDQDPICKSVLKSLIITEDGNQSNERAAKNILGDGKLSMWMHGEGRNSFIVTLYLSVWCYFWQILIK